MPGTKTLLSTIVLMLPSLVNISTLLMLIYFIYAVMGIQLFSKVALKEALHHRANFQTFYLALVTLFRCSTGEYWNELMHDLAGRDPNSEGEPCVDEPEYDPAYCGFEGSDWETCKPLNGCGRGAWSYVYFMSFAIIVSFVFVNLFVTVILETFEVATKNALETKVQIEGSQKQGMNPAEYSFFCALWNK